MAADEYTSAAGGGLRLKGVSGSKITKHKKKRPKQPENEKRSSSANPDAKASEIDEQVQNDDGQEKGLEEESKIVTDDAGDRDGPEDRSQQRGKTEAELRHEERRRRRLEERLKREGTKTHKERVEEFNHYLSNLSEHHDMPRIGPG
ncbi:MAG: hypothetical protein L6R39_001850 [Caloplaca ligustica]|nr:MAG: hypothetical protein L6R39_001850 [Caloplaca ligustica]